MTLTIDLSPEMATQLHGEAAREGLDAPEYVVSALKERLTQVQAQPPTETELLRRISQGLPEETWEHYHGLVAKRRAETLTPEEHATLITLSNQIEVVNAQRIGYAADLANLRHTTLEAVMHSLGLGPRPYA